MNKGLFVTFEGGEGSGKTSKLVALAKHLEKKYGLDVLATREPGGTLFGEGIRNLLLNKDMGCHPNAELPLFVAGRIQHAEYIVKPAIERGAIVLCDRFKDSTWAYQVVGRYDRRPDVVELYHMIHNTLVGITPSRSYFFDIEPELGLRRASARNIESGITKSEGRIDAESLDFHTKVYGGFKELIQKEPERWAVIDSRGSWEESFDFLVADFEDFLYYRGLTSNK